ncbi:UNVERIFIED_CONTAM: hypothetical protein K2H54_029802 [Gekko kuhli]
MRYFKMLTKKWYSKAFKKFKNVSLVLAHGRNLQEIVTLGSLEALEWRRVKKIYMGRISPLLTCSAIQGLAGLGLSSVPSFPVSIHLWPNVTHKCFNSTNTAA